MPSAEDSHWTSILFQVHSAKSQRPRQQNPKEVWRGPGCVSDESQAARGLCIRSPLFTLHFTDHDGRPPTPVTQDRPGDATATKGPPPEQRRRRRLNSIPSHPIPSISISSVHRQQRPSLFCFNQDVVLIVVHFRPSAPQQLIATLPVYY